MNGLLRNLAVYGESVSLYEPELQKSVGMRVKGDFHLFKRRGRKISGGVQATPLSELQQRFGIWVKAFHTNRRGEANFWWG